MHSRILGYVVVLAVAAAEVASYGRYGIGEGARQKVEERFLFNRVDILTYQSSINKAIQGAVPVLSYPADPSLLILYFTMMTAEQTLDFVVAFRQLLIECRFMHFFTLYI